MREAGIEKPNPRKQILNDMAELIRTKRLEGYRPIVMMDANGDYNRKTKRDEGLGEFMNESGLADQYYDRFPDSIRTYMYGNSRLDYILMDPLLVPAVVSIGYLGSHDAEISDHVQGYVDFDTKKLFSGKINRPMNPDGREFRLEQTNRTVKFIDTFIPSAKEVKLKEKVMTLAANFIKHGRSVKNVAAYQKLDQIFTDLALGSAHKVSRKNFGYTRSPELALNGRLVVIAKQMLDCKRRNAPLPQVTVKRAADLKVDTAGFESMTINQCRKAVTARQKALWNTQKNSEDERVEWLKGEAMERAKAAGDEDYEKRLKDMIVVAESRAANRKLKAMMKGTSKALDG